MTIQINADGVQIPVRHIRFSDGCSNLVIDWPEDFKPVNYVNISVDPKTPGDQVLFEVLMAREYVSHRCDDKLKVGLDMPYFPHARADRRFTPQNARPLVAFLEAIESNFDVIYLTDPHSDVIQIRLKKLYNVETVIKTQADCFLQTPIDPKGDVLLVAPDEGAVPKAREISERTGEPLVYATKTRDTSTGRITSTSLPDGDYVGKRCIIVDDIADGGGTFIPLAQALLGKGAASVELYVTHGIFAKGLEPFRGIISKIHVYQIVSNYITYDDLKEYNV